MIRKLCALALPLVLAFAVDSQAVAQNGSLTVSTPSKDGSDIITVRFEEGPETKHVEVKVPVTKGMDLKKKATDFAEALQKELKAKGHGDKIKVEASGNDINFTPADGIELKSLKLTGASGQRDKWSAANFFEGDVELNGDIIGVDGFEKASVLALGTARGVVELSLAEFESVESAMHALAQGLADLGIQAEMTGFNSISLSLDDKDEGIIFECTDLGLSITGELSTRDD